FNIPSGCLKKSQPIADYAPRLSAFHGAQRTNYRGIDRGIYAKLPYGPRYQVAGIRALKNG
ncbi:hypothetical protein, partial [Legionella israelensis]|uniref:hypothetical protein n=1 Tax=Legionella israelensis TaxID=454 RepID=UPI001EE6B7E3